MADDDEVTKILRGSRVLVAIAARALAAYTEDVTVPQLRALVLVGKRGPLRPADVAAELEIDSSTATRLVDRLVRKGLLDRQRDEVDRRVVYLTATAEGSALLDSMSRHRSAAIARLIAQMDPVTREQLRLGLDALADVAAEAPETGPEAGEWTFAWDDDAALREKQQRQETAP